MSSEFCFKIGLFTKDESVYRKGGKNSQQTGGKNTGSTKGSSGKGGNRPGGGGGIIIKR